MLKILAFANNPTSSSDYNKKLESTRTKNSSSKKSKDSIPPSSKKKLDKFCNQNTKKKNKLKNVENKSVNSYQYIQKKAMNYINCNAKNISSNKKNKPTTDKKSQKIEFNNNTKEITFSSSVCFNNANNKKIKNKRPSIDYKISNLTTDKKIKEIKIKPNFNMPFINLFVNKNNKNEIQNLKTCRNKRNISNIKTRKEDNDISFEQNKTKLDSMCSMDTSTSVYQRKKIKFYNSSSMDKLSKKNNIINTMNTIQSIEISFRPKVFINKFKLVNNNNNKLIETKINKAIIIQKNFRKFLVRKYKNIMDEKIIKGISYLNNYTRKKVSFSLKAIFMSYKNKYKKNGIRKDAFYVDSEQMELLDILKKKNIYSMMDLKKYIVCLIKDNKLDMF